MWGGVYNSIRRISSLYLSTYYLAVFSSLDARG